MSHMAHHHRSVCNKHGITLTANRNRYDDGDDDGDEQYTLQFHIHNPNIDLRGVFNMELYLIMATVNSDLIQHIEIERIDTYTGTCTDTDVSMELEAANVLLLLNNKATAKLGISPKYTYTNLRITRTPEMTRIDGSDILMENAVYPPVLKNYLKRMNENAYTPDGQLMWYSPPPTRAMQSRPTSMIITHTDAHNAVVNYTFSLDLFNNGAGPQNTPRYVKDMAGLMMKKIFYRLKGFIETLDYSRMQR